MNKQVNTVAEVNTRVSEEGDAEVKTRANTEVNAGVNTRIKAGVNAMKPWSDHEGEHRSEGGSV